MRHGFHLAVSYFTTADFMLPKTKSALVSLALLFSLVFSICASTRVKILPRFEDYPVHEIYQGAIAPPILDTSQKKEYAIQIENGINNGYGVFRDYQEQKGPNFAGHMIVIRWGCGSPCLRMALVDARNGEVYFPPSLFSDDDTSSFDLPLLVRDRSVPENPELEFRLDSCLMIMKATPRSHIGDQPAFTYYFLWKQNRWKLLRKIPMKSN